MQSGHVAVLAIVVCRTCIVVVQPPVGQGVATALVRSAQLGRHEYLRMSHPSSATLQSIDRWLLHGWWSTPFGCARVRKRCAAALASSVHPAVVVRLESSGYHAGAGVDVATPEA